VCSVAQIARNVRLMVAMVAHHCRAFVSGHVCSPTVVIVRRFQRYTLMLCRCCARFCSAIVCWFAAAQLFVPSVTWRFDVVADVFGCGVSVPCVIRWAVGCAAHAMCPTTMRMQGMGAVWVTMRLVLPPLSSYSIGVGHAAMHEV
jgi:hypothetical protein